jgi:hypothetical protein
MYLLDTAVLWALREARERNGAEGLASWASDIPPSSMFLSVVSLMELEGGISRLERRDKSVGASARSWLTTQLRSAFDNRVLPIDAAVADRAGKLGYADARDGLLAATALEHGMTLVTRETAAFKMGRVRTLNPWAYRPEARAMDWEDGSLTGSVWLKSLFR